MRPFLVRGSSLQRCSGAFLSSLTGGQINLGSGAVPPYPFALAPTLLCAMSMLLLCRLQSDAPCWSTFVDFSIDGAPQPWTQVDTRKFIAAPGSLLAKPATAAEGSLFETTTTYGLDLKLAAFGSLPSPCLPALAGSQALSASTLLESFETSSATAATSHCTGVG